MLAFTREVSLELARCELTHQARQPIDVARARKQHAAYEAALANLGCAVHRLPAPPGCPDAVFIEDTAVVLDELAVITRPGAESRRPEPAAVADALRPFRPLAEIQAPATLDGGDVLRLGRTLYVGLSGRTTAAAVEQLAALVTPHGYRVQGVAVGGCLHLKTAVCEVADGVLLGNPAWVDRAAFGPVEWIDAAADEPAAANALRVGPAVVYPAGFPATRERLERRGVRLRAVDVSELAKAEGGVTCCCLLVPPPRR